MGYKTWTYKNNPFFDKENKKIIELVNQKKSTEEIAKIFGSSESMILKRRKYLGIKSLAPIKKRKSPERKNVKCAWCDNELSIIPYNYKKFKNHFCDKNCFNKYIKENPLKYWVGKKISKEHYDKLQKGKMKKVLKDGYYNQIKFSEEDKNLIIQSYREGHTSTYIAKLFDVDCKTILRNLCKWGIKIRTPLHPIKIKCDDGHIVKSEPEAYICNFLTHNNIKHFYEKQIGCTNYLYDFYLPDYNIYIEYFGLFGALKGYDEKIELKKNIYKKLDLKLISIFPKDNLPLVLNNLLILLNKQQIIIKYEK